MALTQEGIRPSVEMKTWCGVRAVAQLSPSAPFFYHALLPIFLNWEYPAIAAQICATLSYALETVAMQMLQTQASTRRQASSGSTGKNRQAQADTHAGTVKHSQAQAGRHR